jgi:hypothetical protein
VDHRQEHHQHHRQERERRIAKEKEREREEENLPRVIHPAWFLVLGVVLTVLAVLVWTFMFS